MQSTAATVEEYIKQLPADRVAAIKKLRNEIVKNLPEGFEEQMAYGMIGYVVPHKLYPKGYHVNPKLPLMMMSVGSQKNYIVIHHMGLYADNQLLNWFTSEHKKTSTKKLDMGKGCIRLKDLEVIPYDLIGNLARKLTTSAWIKMHENAFSSAKSKSK